MSISNLLVDGCPLNLFANSLTLSGDIISTGGDIIVSGTAAIGETLTVNTSQAGGNFILLADTVPAGGGNATIGNDLTVDGNSTLGGTLDVLGDTGLDGNLLVTEDLLINGTSQFNNDVAIGNNTTNYTLTVNGEPLSYVNDQEVSMTWTYTGDAGADTVSPVSFSLIGKTVTITIYPFNFNFTGEQGYWVTSAAIPVAYRPNNGYGMPFSLVGLYDSMGAGNGYSSSSTVSVGNPAWGLGPSQDFKLYLFYDIGVTGSSFPGGQNPFFGDGTADSSSPISLTYSIN